MMRAFTNTVEIETKKSKQLKTVLENEICRSSLAASLTDCRFCGFQDLQENVGQVKRVASDVRLEDKDDSD